MAAFDIQHPGVKEFLIVGGLAFGGYLLYEHMHKSSSSSGSSSAGGGGGSGSSTPTGFSTTDFTSWIRDHSTSTSTTTSHGQHHPGGHHPSSARTTVPDFRRERWEPASNEARKDDLRLQSTTPRRKNEAYKIQSQTPRAGRRVRRGSVVKVGLEPVREHGR